MAIVGRSTVLVSPSFRGFQTQVGKAAAGAGKTFGDQMGKSSPSIGSRLATGIGNTFKKGVAAVGVVAGAGLGYALVKGFGRLQAIDQAQAKLTGLGHSAKGVDGIMTDALKSVKGTAFGLDEAATTAGAVVAAGIKPGKDLQGVLTTVADTATIAGTSMSDMGAIFGSVAARGKLQGDDMMQLTSKGVPVLQFLAKHYGITAQEASKMVSEGKVDFKNFAAAMKENIGGAAQDSGKTFTGALANLQASLGRIGAGLLGGVFPQLAPMLTRVTKAMAPLEDAAAKLGEALGKKFAGPASAVAGVIEKLSKAVSGGGGGLLATLGGMAPALGPATGALVALGSAGFAPLLKMIPGMAGIGGVLGALGGPIGVLVASIGGLIATSPALRTSFLDLIKQIATTLGSLGKQVLPLIIPAFVQLAQALGGALAKILPVVGKALGVIAQALGGALVAVLPTVASLLGNLAGTVFPLLASIITQLVPPLANLVVSLFPIAVTIIKALVPVVMAVVNAFLPLVQAILPILVILIKALTPVLTLVAKAIAFVVTIAAKLVTAFLKWQTSTGVAGAALNGIKNIAAAVAGWFKSAFVPFFTRTIPGAFRAMIGVAKTVGSALSGVFHSIAAVAKWLWASILKPVFSAIGTAFRAVGRVFAVIGKAIGTAFRAVGKVIKTIYNGWIKPIFQLFAAIVKWLVVKYVQAYLAVLKTAWRAMATLIKSIYNSVIKPIIHAFAAVVKWLWAKILKPQIAAIKAGWHALGAGIKSIYNSVIKPIIHAFATAGKWLWQKILKPQIAAIKAAWHGLGAGIKAIYNSVIKPILNAFGKAAGTAKNVAAKAFGGVKSAWSSTSKHLGNVFHGAMSKTFSAFKTAGSGMKSAFGTAVSGIGKAWSKLSELAKKPIHFIIDSVINKGIIHGFNTLAKAFGTKAMKALPVPFDRGGILPGTSRASQGDDQIISARRGEGVTVTEALDPYERSRLLSLNKAALRGESAASFRNRFEGFRAGGLVGGSGRFSPLATKKLMQAQQLAGQQFSIFQRGYRPSTSYSGTSHQGDAIDTGPVNQKVVAALRAVGWAAWDRTGKGNWVPHIHAVPLPGAGYGAGSAVWQAKDYLKGGDGLGGKDNGPRGFIGKLKNLGKAAFDKMASMLGGLADNIPNPADLIKGAVTKIIGGAKWLNQTPFGQLAAKVPVTLAERAVAYAKKKFADFLSFTGIGGQSATWAGGKVGSWNGEQLNNAATIIKTAQANGFGNKGALIGLMTAMQESTLRNLTGGDRDSVGLFQQRAPWGPFSARHNPAQAAAMFFNGGKGGQPGLKSKNWRGMSPGAAAQAVQVSAFPGAYTKWQGQAQALIDKYAHGKGGYAAGTRNASAGLHAIAEHTPELVIGRQTRLFRGGEQVLNGQQTAGLLGGPQTVRITSGALDIRNGKAYIADAVGEIVREAAVSY